MGNNIEKSKVSGFIVFWEFSEEWWLGIAIELKLEINFSLDNRWFCSFIENFKNFIEKFKNFIENFENFIENCRNFIGNFRFA